MAMIADRSAERRVLELVKPEQPTENQALGILLLARYALRWNTPEVAAARLLKNQARITELKGQTEIGSPTQKAETRHLVAKTLEEVTRLRRLGLASGTDEERSPGMIFAVPLGNKKSKDQPTPIRKTPLHEIADKDASYQWVYLPHAEIERALESSYQTQSGKPNIDSYVFRVAMGFVVSGDGPKTPPSDRGYSVDLDPIAASGLMRVAEHMKDNGLHGRIPSRTERRIRETLHSGGFPSTQTPTKETLHSERFPSSNVLDFSAVSQTPNEEKVRSA